MPASEKVSPTRTQELQAQGLGPPWSQDVGIHVCPSGLVICSVPGGTKALVFQNISPFLVLTVVYKV